MTEAHNPTEDVPYSQVDDFAYEDEDFSESNDEDTTVETKLIQDIRKYIKEAKNEHNSFDIIDLTEQAKMTPTQQIAMHKCVVQHLRNIEQMINDKIKEN